MSAGSFAPVSIICGPTAAGKSALALRLAERHRLAIVSADSRQVYRGFDIGTAKPTRLEQGRVPHFGIDVAEPTERYSAARWAANAERWLAGAGTHGRGAVVVGGTGFYIRALTEPLFEEPALDPARRAALEPILAGMPNDELRRWCEALDAGRAHLGRAQLVRAVEVSLLSGRRLSDLHREASGRPRRAARYLVVDPGPALAGQIGRRVDAMLDGGWVEEARALDATVPDGAPAWSASGYRVARALARGTIERPAAAEQIVVETRQYAKRQRTWFRHQLPAAVVTTVDPRRPDADAVVDGWWRKAVAA